MKTPTAFLALLASSVLFAAAARAAEIKHNS